MPTLQIPEVFDYQRELIFSPARFLSVSGGRRSGKSLSSMWRQAIFSWQYPNTNHWTVDQTLGEVRKWFRYAIRLFPKEAFAQKPNYTDRRLVFRNGSVWEFRSADRPETLRGSGLDSFVGHEAAFWDEESWNTVRPALSDRLGWAVLNSTPKGRNNWFFAHWQRGNEDPGDGWENSRASFSWPTSINPKILPGEIDEARNTLPDATFRQEYLGEFTSDSGSLFKIHANCWTGAFEPHVDGGRYVAGFDLAKRRDWSAWVVLRVDCLPWRIVDFGRMKQVEYLTQAAILEKKFKEYRVRLALSDPWQESLNELLRDRNVPVEEFVLGGTSRPTLLINLAVPLEKGEIRIPINSSDPERQRDIAVLRGEFENFTPQVSKRGSVRYEAAHGYNDDYVFALAMAVEAAKRQVKEGSGGGFLAVQGRRIFR